MKKSIFTKYLPFVAAVLLTASCGKDYNGDGIEAQPLSIEESTQPEQNPEASNTVSIPFSVRVGGGKSLSKIQYAEKDGEMGKLVEREFTPSDCGNIQLTVSGGATALLDLKSRDEGGKTVYYFDGVISVLPEYLTDFKNGGIDLTGTFTTNGESDTYYSTTSLLDLEQKCKHVYKAEFKSNADNIMLVDQNAYLSVTVYEKQTEFSLTFNGEETARTFTPNDDHKIWIAVPCGGDVKPSVKGALISRSGIDLEPSTVYNADRTDRYEENGVVFVNLGITGVTADGTPCSTWWADENVTGGEGTNKNGVWYYTFDQAQKLVESLGITLPTGGNSTDYNEYYPNTDFLNLYNQCYWVKVTDASNNFKGYNVFKSKDKNLDKGLTKKTSGDVTYKEEDTHIFLPAAGYCLDGDGPCYVGYGRCWSSTEYDEGHGFYLYFGGGNVDPESCGRRYYECPVRAVRRM